MGIFQKLAKSVGHKTTRKEVNDLIAKIGLLEADEANLLFDSVSDTETVQGFLGSPFDMVFKYALLNTGRENFSEEHRQNVARLLNRFTNAQSETDDAMQKWSLYIWRVTALTMLDDEVYPDGLRLWQIIQQKANEVGHQDAIEAKPTYFE